MSRTASDGNTGLRFKSTDDTILRSHGRLPPGLFPRPGASFKDTLLVVVWCVFVLPNLLRKRFQGNPEPRCLGRRQSLHPLRETAGDF